MIKGRLKAPLTQLVYSAPLLHVCHALPPSPLLAQKANFKVGRTEGRRPSWPAPLLASPPLLLPSPPPGPPSRSIKLGSCYPLSLRPRGRSPTRVKLRSTWQDLEPNWSWNVRYPDTSCGSSSLLVARYLDYSQESLKLDAERERETEEYEEEG